MDWAFHPASSVKLNHDLVTMSWSFGPSSQPTQVTGSDFLFVGDDGLVTAVYMLIDGISDMPPATTNSAIIPATSE